MKDPGRGPCKVCLRDLCLVHCVYCEADVESEEHGSDCPSTTGLFPVFEDSDMACPICHAPFEEGDVYVQRTLEPGHPAKSGIAGAGIVMALCVGCSALDRETPE